MAMIVKYTCDKCGHVQPTDVQMWKLKVAYNPVRSSGGWSASDIWSSKEQMWCRACVEKIGLVPVSPKPPADAPKPKLPTLEEMIREIARDELSVVHNP